MSVIWDPSHLVSLVSRVEERCSLVHGELVVEHLDGVEENMFAGYVNLPDKQFNVVTNIDNSVGDVSISVLMGYVVAMAYDRDAWSSDPSLETLRECHSLVCDAMEEYNPSVYACLVDHLDLLEAWLEQHSNRDLLALDDEDSNVVVASAYEDAVDSMGLDWFSSDDKKWIN